MNQANINQGLSIAPAKPGILLRQIHHLLNHLNNPEQESFWIINENTIGCPQWISILTEELLLLNPDLAVALIGVDPIHRERLRKPVLPTQPGMSIIEAWRKSEVQKRLHFIDPSQRQAPRAKSGSLLEENIEYIQSQLTLLSQTHKQMVVIYNNAVSLEQDGNASNEHNLCYMDSFLSWLSAELGIKIFSTISLPSDVRVSNFSSEQKALLGKLSSPIVGISTTTGNAKDKSELFRIVREPSGAEKGDLTKIYYGYYIIKNFELAR